MEVVRYDASQLDLIPWPRTVDGDYAKRCLVPWMRDGIRPYIHNVITDLHVIIAGGIVLPLTVNDEDYENSYVCSPYTHYVTYAEQELYLLDSPSVRALFRYLLRGLGGAAKTAAVNRVACVNNWLVSTNLYPSIEKEHVNSITGRLINEFPNHAIIWRSVSEAQPELFSTFLSAGYTPVVSRQIYWFDGKEMPKTRDTNKDLGLIRKTPYQAVLHEELSAQDAARLLELYGMLYLKKYFPTNPQYTEAFFRQAIEEKTFELYGFKQGENISAILGYVVRNGVMAAPFFGYDTLAPQKDGLYRLISLKLMQEALRRNCVLHSSSGAAQFKRNRGAKPFLEYNMVYARHLPVVRRLFWDALSFLSIKVGGRILRTLRL